MKKKEQPKKVTKKQAKSHLDSKLGKISTRWHLAPKADNASTLTKNIKTGTKPTKAKSVKVKQPKKK